MVAPGFLQNPEVRRWLNGIEPAWTMLEFNSLNALHEEPSASNPAIHLEAKGLSGNKRINFWENREYGFTTISSYHMLWRWRQKAHDRNLFAGPVAFTDQEFLD